MIDGLNRETTSHRRRKSFSPPKVFVGPSALAPLHRRQIAGSVLSRALSKANAFCEGTRMDRTQKEEMVADLREAFEDSQIVIVSKQTGLSVPQTQALRRAMRAEGATLRVAKNRLVKIAVKDTAKEALSDMMTGPTAISYSTDPVAPAKVLADFAKNNDKIEILGAVMGDKFLSAAEVGALAKLPSLDQLRGKLVGLIQAPATKVAGVIQAPASQLARVFAAYGAKDAA